MAEPEAAAALTKVAKAMGETENEDTLRVWVRVRWVVTERMDPWKLWDPDFPGSESSEWKKEPDAFDALAEGLGAMEADALTKAIGKTSPLAMLARRLGSVAGRLGLSEATAAAAALTKALDRTNGPYAVRELAAALGAVSGRLRPTLRSPRPPRASSRQREKPITPTTRASWAGGWGRWRDSWGQGEVQRSSPPSPRPWARPRTPSP